MIPRFEKHKGKWYSPFINLRNELFQWFLFFVLVGCAVMSRPMTDKEFEEHQKEMEKLKEKYKDK